MATKTSRAAVSIQLGSSAAGRQEFPGLGPIAAKLGHALTAVCAELGGKTRIESVDTQTMTFGAWKATLPATVAVARYRERTIKGGILVSVPQSLIVSLVNIFYGGDSSEEGDAGHLGAAGQRLFDRFATGVADALTASWADVASLAPAWVANSFATEGVTLGKPGDNVVIQRFGIDAAAAGKGTIDIVYPLAALRGIAGLHGVADSAVEEVDPVWRMRLSDAVRQARLPVRTVIARPTVPLSCLMALAPGDFIPVTLPKRVPLTVAGRLLAHGTIGEANGRAAIMIDKLEQGEFSDA